MKKKTPKPSSDYCLIDLVNLWWFPVFKSTTVKFWSIVVSSSRASLVNLFTQGQLWFTKLDDFWKFWKGMWGGDCQHLVKCIKCIRGKSAASFIRGSSGIFLIHFSWLKGPTNSIRSRPVNKPFFFVAGLLYFLSIHWGLA